MRDDMAVQTRTTRRWKPLDVQTEIFHHERNAGEWAGRWLLTLIQGPLESSCDDRIDGRIAFFDTRNCELDELSWRNLLVANEPRESGRIMCVEHFVHANDASEPHCSVFNAPT